MLDLAVGAALWWFLGLWALLSKLCVMMGVV